MKSISPILLCIVAAIMMFTVKLSAFFLPDRMYFSFSSFLYSSREILKFEALFFKLLVPFLVAFVCSLGVYWFRQIQHNAGKSTENTDYIIEHEMEVSISSAGFITALLFAWPYILLWDLLIDPSLVQYRLPFLICYSFYFLGFFYVARAGVQLVQFLRSDRKTMPPLFSSEFYSSPMMQPVASVFKAALTTAISGFLVGTLS